jgi:hypothetical protein
MIISAEKTLSSRQVLFTAGSEEEEEEEVSKPEPPLEGSISSVLRP